MADPIAGWYKQDAGYTRKPHGSILIDGEEVANTMQCCHCDAHYILRRGSGVKRGWCRNCGQVTCGRPQCDPCVPFMRRLEEIERKGTLALRLGV